MTKEGTAAMETVTTEGTKATEFKGDETRVDVADTGVADVEAMED